MALSILALFVYLFGAYAYAYLAMLYFRRQPVQPLSDAVRHLERVSRAMFVTCTTWFVVLAIIEFRFLMGESREDDFIDLLSLELTVLFPALIFHMTLAEARVKEQANSAAAHWPWILAALYGAGVFFAIFFPGVIFNVIPIPREYLGRSITVAIMTLFIACSIACLALMQSRPKRPPSLDQMKLLRALRFLFAAMIVVFMTMLMMPGQAIVTILGTAARATPLLFLLVSVYFENRIEFYDLVIKRGVLLMATLVAIAGAAMLSLGTLEALPEGAARPWLLAVLLLPVALFMPWLHERGGRLLDRLWFGRDFTPVDAVKHVLAAMQAATDEPSLVAATESALSDIFHRRMTVLPEPRSMSDDLADTVEIRTAAGTPVRFAVACDRDASGLLSEDVALLRSLGGVFGYMLENVRLQRKRLEQEQVAQELRLQSSRSELKALRAQINPHFLFNALNAIASLIHTDPSRADAAVEQLAEVFRYTLRRSEHEWAPLDQELAFARAYLDVEQARFGKRLEYSFVSPTPIPRAHVPSMLLQTLVENAVKHGIARVRGQGHIAVVTSVSPGRLTIEVRDTGPGPDEARDPVARSGESFGLRSVHDRLRGHFGDDASLQLRREGPLTIARLELPLIEELSPIAGNTR
jgi:signal transduction histidine kinase